MESNVFNCGHCTFNTTSIVNLEKHLKTKHREPEEYEYTCSMCDYSTTVQRNLKRHFANQHSKDISPSDDSSKINGEEMIKCNLCDFTCKSPKGLGVHKYRSHILPNEKLQTSETKVAESKRDEEENESKTKRNETKPPIQASNEESQPQKGGKALNISNDILKVCIRCSVCEFMCNSLRSMSEHIESVHSPNSNPQSEGIVGGVDSDQTAQPLSDVASDNDATFNSLNDGDQGALLSGFICSLCNKKYDKNWKLTRHMKTTHASNSNLDGKDDETEMVDFEHKNKDSSLTEETFLISTVNSSPRSQSSHSKKNQSTCPICERVLSNPTNLKRHMMSLHPNNTQIKKNQEQPDNSPLNVEIATPPPPGVTSKTPPPVTSAGKFECNICNTKFTRRFTLKQHKKRLHSTLDLTDERVQVEDTQPLSEVNCSICNRNFDSNEALQRHNLRRHNEGSSVQKIDSTNTVYTCNICNEKVIGKIKLVYHVKKFHYNIKREIAFDDMDIVEDVDIVEDGDDVVVESGPDPKKQKTDIGQGRGRQPKRKIKSKN